MLSLLHTFIAVYEKKSFSQAAALLYISQPTVSTHIHRLEELTDTPLFVRHDKNGIVPTPFGVLFYERSRYLVNYWNCTMNELQQTKNKRKRMSILMSHSIAEGYFNDFIPLLISCFPDIDFDFRVYNSEDIINEVIQNSKTLGLIEKPLTHKKLTANALLNDELVHVGDVNSPYWLMREPHSGLHFYQELYFDQHKLDLNKLSTNNISFIYKLLQNNIGQTLVSKKALENLPGIPWEPTNISRSLTLVSNPLVTEDDTLKALSQFICKTLKNNFPPTA
ncbi:LysR family transcriptional regulator [Brochothrix campestris]|uniref:Transcriptional regulator, LysR family protein n=1 Tax=Brochothrix campestris FSL F6-1037 TaxID=1265861 RepID=W7CQD9_9LIST|nr:LysR family transcriptional regulator [Brochothrix campestris]EUJ35193.1 transcriptional regulator, LysR family protein [Brochothrix campestris FSL F6-1037]